MDISNNFYFFLLIFGFYTTSSLGMTCLKCSSDENKDCAQNPEKIYTFENCTWGCLTKIESGVTIRRCLYSMIEPCSNEFCKTCFFKDECNNEIYPKDRPVCRHCTPEDNDCMDVAPIRSSLPCLNYHSEDKCYTKIHDNGKVSRGCLSDDIDIKCADDVKCKTCNSEKYHACNNNLSKTTCFECSSENSNTACIRPDPYSEDCNINYNTSMCTYLADKDIIDNTCFTLNKDGIVKRGCSLQDKEFTVDETNLKYCKGDNCNSECVKDLKCIQCNSDSNDNNTCNNSNQLIDADSCPAYTITCHQCESEDRSKTIRNCGNGNHPSHVCSTCAEKDGCNNNGKLPLSCYSCNSEFDSNCAQWTNDVTTKSCKDGDKCLALIKDGHTIRGCASDFPNINCDDNSSCKVCESHNCNGGLFPSDRRICYQCNGTLECNASQLNPDQPSNACRMYTPEEKCYMFGNDTAMIRGCSSDEDENYDKCKDQTKCTKCSTNNCNGFSYERTSTLSCIKCTNTTEACAWGYKEEDGINCYNKLFYYETEDCFTYTHEDYTVSRNCELHSSLCKDDKWRCKKCKNRNGCNNKNTKLQKCITCNSQTPGQESCAETAEGVIPTICKSTIQQYKERGCYTANKDGIILRGCIVDLEDKDILNECKNDESEKCDYCNKFDGCNNETAPGSANFLSSFSLYNLITSYLIGKIFLI